MGTRAEINQDEINRGPKPRRFNIWNRNKPIYTKETQVKPKVHAKVAKKPKFTDGGMGKATLYFLIILAKITILLVLYWTCRG